MNKLTLTSVKKNNDTSVSNIFLDKYMPMANGEFVKVYLYLLRCLTESKQAVTVSDIADRLNHTENDVLRALKYWEQSGILSIGYDSDQAEPSSITFLPLEDKTTPIQSDTTDKEVQAATVAQKISHSPAQLKRLKEREDIKQLLYIVEKYIGKPLTTSEADTVLYINETLGFTVDLIEHLVEYCVTNNHKSLRYIEKVALAWAESGITTVEAAKESVAIYSQSTNCVMKAFGISDRNPSQIEAEFIAKWFDDYGFDKEMVVEACNRTILTKHQPNFSYTDGILRKWRTEKLHTLDELKIFDDSRKIRTAARISTVASVSPAKAPNKFNNFSQRSYDFVEIEKELISNNK